MTMHTTGSGTLSFAAPERLKDHGKGYTQKVDIWSAGILLVMLLTGQHPFSDYNGSAVHLIKQILNGQKLIAELLNQHDNISEEVKCLVLQLVNINPVDRLSANEALKHRWFTKTDWESTQQLDTTQENLAKRKFLKEMQPEEFHKAENFSMTQVSKEIVKNGLEKPKMKKQNSMMIS